MLGQQPADRVGLPLPPTSEVNGTGTAPAGRTIRAAGDDGPVTPTIVASGLAAWTSGWRKTGDLGGGQVHRVPDRPLPDHPDLHPFVEPRAVILVLTYLELRR